MAHKSVRGESTAKAVAYCILAKTSKPELEVSAGCLKQISVPFEYEQVSRKASMGRSRRERVVALTKTRKAVVGREAKGELLEDIRTQVDKYANIYVFSTQNMRNSKLKDLRGEWKDSRFFFGRKRIAQVAFGRSEEEEYADGLRHVSERLVGNVGILFTNRDHKAVVEFFERYEQADFARSGFVATEAARLSEGPLDMFVPSQEANVRQLGLPVTLKRGVVTLLKEFEVCKKGDVLTPERAKILEFLGIRMALFRLTLLCHFNKDSGFEELVVQE